MLCSQPCEWSYGLLFSLRNLASRSIGRKGHRSTETDARIQLLLATCSSSIWVPADLIYDRKGKIHFLSLRLEFNVDFYYCRDSGDSENIAAVCLPLGKKASSYRGVYKLSTVYLPVAYLWSVTFVDLLIARAVCIWFPQAQYLQKGASWG